MLRSILVPLDGSEFVENAIPLRLVLLEVANYSSRGRIE